MRSSLYFVFPAVAIAALIGCVEKSGVDYTAPAATSTPASEGMFKTSGLPCDVAEFLATNCAECHGPTPVANPVSLVTLDDLTATSSDGQASVGAAAVARLADTKSPMPPAGVLSAATTDVFTAWVSGGMTRGECAEEFSSANPYATDPVCTSNTHWTRGDRGSASMHPGGACIDCHERENEGPFLTIAGTLFPTAHEPDDCNGTNTGSAKVIITDAKGKETSYPVNAVGNFYGRTTIAAPYRARIVANGKTRVMATAQKSGDCNTCHTENGAKEAPGRIMLP